MAKIINESLHLKRGEQIQAQSIEELDGLVRFFYEDIDFGSSCTYADEHGVWYDDEEELMEEIEEDDLWFSRNKDGIYSYYSGRYIGYDVVYNPLINPKHESNGIIKGIIKGIKRWIERKY